MFVLRGYPSQKYGWASLIRCSHILMIMASDSTLVKDPRRRWVGIRSDGACRSQDMRYKGVSDTVVVGDRGWHPSHPRLPVSPRAGPLPNHLGRELEPVARHPKRSERAHCKSRPRCTATLGWILIAGVSHAYATRIQDRSSRVLTPQAQYGAVRYQY